MAHIATVARDAQRPVQRVVGRDRDVPGVHIQRVGGTAVRHTQSAHRVYGAGHTGADPGQGAAHGEPHSFHTGRGAGVGPW